MLWQLIHLDLRGAPPTLVAAQSAPQFADCGLRPDNPADELTSRLTLMAALTRNLDQVSPMHEVPQRGVSGDRKVLRGRHWQILAPLTGQPARLEAAYCMATESQGLARRAPGSSPAALARRGHSGTRLADVAFSRVLFAPNGLIDPFAERLARPSQPLERRPLIQYSQVSATV